MPARLVPVGGRGKLTRLARSALFALLALACATGAPSSPEALPLGRPTPGHDAPLDRAAARWVDETLASLDLRERVAQLVMVWMTGAYASTSSEELRRIDSLVVNERIGGVVISLGTPHAYVAKLNYLQARSRVPLLIAADFEAGAGFRLGGIYALPHVLDMGGATQFPPAMAFGAIGDERFARELGRITAVEARAVGVHLNFAPVLDVNSNPLNPIINTRSFGEDPERVAALGAAYLRGAREGGLLTTAKHFPGHGDTEVDSHLELPAISADRERLERVELVPFRRAVEEGVDAIMTAHIAAPGIEGPEAAPATLSPYFMTELLRNDIGFRGLIFTDALDMGAIVRGFGGAEAAVRALEAGSDVLLMPPDPGRAIDGVVAAVRAGRLDAGRIEASARRVLEMKARAGLDRGRRVDPEAVPEIVGSAAHAEFAESAARRAITLPRDRAGLLPLDPARSRRLFSLTLAREGDLAAGRAFDARLRETVPAVAAARTMLSTPGSTYDSLAAMAGSSDVVIVSAYVPPRSAAGSIDVPPELGRFIAAVEARGKPVVLVSFGSPYLLTSIPEAGTYLLAWGGAPVAQRAAADAILGHAPITGRLPISLPPFHALGEGLVQDPPRAREAEGGQAAEDAPPLEEVPAAEVGMDAEALARVDDILARAIAGSVTPGAALAVGRHGRLVRLRGYGRTDWNPAAPPVTPATLYDLASLTKVVGTTTAVMRLVERGAIELDAPVARHLPEWGEGWKADVTVRDLLLHRSGLPPFRPFWRELSGPAAYREAIAALEPEYEPGTGTVYSDLGFITLAFVAEAAGGAPLEAQLESGLFARLGMLRTGFNPPAALRDEVAPTEVDTTFRHTHVHGVVHDENAYALGGVAGHAGLFSSARDLASFAGWILAAARVEASGPGAAGARVDPPPSAEGGASGAVDALPSPATVAAFTRRHDPSSSRALGWDTPSGRSSAGRYLTTAAFGHTGFTGTSLWVDPELDLFVVLLTNRVNPTRDNPGHIPLRRAVHDAVALAIRDVPVRPRIGGG